MSFQYPKHVRFSCVKCALCCGDTKAKVRKIFLLKSEANQISKKVLLDRNKFADRIFGFKPYVFQMKKNEDGKCNFLEDNVCSIYPIRPLICRFYPFQLINLGYERYTFAYTDECPGIGEGPQLKRDFFKGFFGRFMGLMKKTPNNIEF